MFNQSLKFLEYFCFTVDYSLHLLKKSLDFVRTPLPRIILGLYVLSQVHRNALKIAGFMYKPFL